MKAFKIIFAALAATAALAGCAKETTLPSFENDKVNPVAEGTRVIAISFAPQTKTSYTTTETGGIQPTFEGGESILLVSYPEDTNADPITETTTVQFDKKTETATISTNLTGELTAYYPASLASFSAKKNEWYIFVPSEQKDGTFANANICSTTIAENATSANFENMYALFVITPPEGTKKLTIKSLRTIGEEGQRSVEDRPIICGTGDDSFKITVGDGTAVIPSPCYVAMIGGNVNLSDLSFEATFDEEGTTGYIKGITTSAIAANAGTGIAVGSEEYDNANTVRDGTAYTIDGNNWHEYVTIAGRKWATMNVGASKPEDAGDYFMWGEVKGHKADLSKTPSEDVYADAFLSDFSSFSLDSRYKEDLWTPDEGFSGHNTPFVVTATPEENEYVGVLWTCTFSKYTDESGGVLEFCDDAANVNWGGAWHMPTKEDVVSLNNIAEQQWTTDYNSTGTKGSVFSENGQNLFFPASGSGWGSDLKYLTYSYAWSSSYFMVEGNSIPYGIQITSYTDWRVYNPYQASRHLGLPIRAIIDEPKEEIQSDDENENYKHESTTDWFDD